MLLAVIAGLAAYILWIRPSSVTGFKDISGYAAAPQVDYLQSIGVLQGYRDGTFRPAQPVSRAEFIAMLNRAHKFTALAPVGLGGVKSGQWYYEDLRRAAAAGYLPNYPPGYTDFDQAIIREEAAYMLAGAIPVEGTLAAGMVFTDGSSITETYRQAALYVTATGFMNAYPDGSFRPGEVISRADAAMLVRNSLKPDFQLADRVNVKDYGAIGDGASDDTEAINKAIMAASAQNIKTVYIPAGKYLINALESVRPLSHMRLCLAPYAVLQAIPNDSENYAVIRMENLAEVEIRGGTIIGEREAHTGTTGQWGMGIDMEGCSDITVSDVSIANCWGDGIYIGSTKAQNYCEDILIERFDLDNNRRQGISLISGRNVTIRDGVIANTQGHLPQAGIDLEPNEYDESMQEILIENLQTINNAGYGIDFWLGQCAGSSRQFSLTIRNHRDKGSGKGALRTDNIRDCLDNPDLYRFDFVLDN